MSEKEEAVICDIDGTIAIRGERDPYDMSRVGEDEPHRFMCWLIGLIHNQGGMPIVFTSGRDRSAKIQTGLWIQEHVGILEFDLLMRDEGDGRPDEVVKLEMLGKIQKLYTVVAVFDDRDKVVRMWRDNNLFTLQVTGDGNF